MAKRRVFRPAHRGQVGKPLHIPVHFCQIGIGHFPKAGKLPGHVVRVTGFTAYFCALSPEFRQLVIDRFNDGM